MSSPGGSGSRPAKRRRTTSSTPAAHVPEVQPHTGFYLPQSGVVAPDQEDSAGVAASAIVLGGSFPGSMWPAANPSLRWGAFLRGTNTTRMSLFLWMVRCAWIAGITVYVETVVDEEALAKKIGIIMNRIRFYIPVNHEQLDILLSTMESSMEPGGADRAGNSGTSAYKASWANINSPQTFMVALESMRCQPLPAQFSTLSFSTPAASGARNGETDSESSDSDFDNAETGPPDSSAYPANSPLTLLNAQHIFMERLLADDERAGAFEHQLHAATYLGSVGELGFPQCSTEHGLLYKLTPGLGGLLSTEDADGLLNYHLPVDRPSVRDVLSSYIEQQASDGRAVSTAVHSASTMPELEAAIADELGGCAVNKSRPLLAPKWANQSEDAENNENSQLTWPLQASAIHYNQKIMAATRKALRLGTITKTKARRILDGLLRHIASMIHQEHEGINPVYCLLQRDRQRLTSDIELTPPKQQSHAVSVARRLFRSLPKKWKGKPVPISTGIMIQLALAAGDMNMAPAQAEAWLTIWTSGPILAWNVWGLQLGYILLGPPDVGKSMLALRLIQSVPPSLGHQTHQESLQVTSLNQPIGFKWVDEQEKGRTVGKKEMPSVGDLSHMMALSSGCRKKSCYYKGNPQEGIPNVNIKSSAEGRHIGIDLGNNDFAAAVKSRKAVIAMVAGEETDDSPGRGERALRGVTPDEHGRQLCMQLKMCYANMCWFSQAFGLFECASMVWITSLSIFYGLVQAILVPVGFEQVPPRGMERLKKKAIGHMVLRVSTALETSGKSVAERDEMRSAYFMQNAVVSFTDCLLAWRELSALRDDRREKRTMLQVLKSNLKVNADELDTKFVTTASDPDFYVTKIAHANLGQYCTTFGEGLLDTVFKGLSYPTNGKAMVMKFETGEERGMIGVRKTAVDTHNCLTGHQSLIIRLLARVICSDHAGPRLWYPEIDQSGAETGNIAFTKPVLDLIVRPAASALAQFKGWQGVVSSTDVRVAFDQFIFSNGMHELTDSRTALSIMVHCPISTGLVQAQVGGLLDPATVFSGIPEYDALDGAPTAAQRATWATAKVADDTGSVSVPGPVPMVANLTIHGGFLVRKEVLGVPHAVSVRKHQECNMKPPEEGTPDDKMDAAMQQFVDLLMAASGEAEPGVPIYFAPDGGKKPPFKLHVVGECADPQGVRILNPMRGRDTSYDEYMMGEESDEEIEVDPITEILPPGEKYVQIRPGNNLFAHFVAMHQKHNVPEL